MNSTLTSFLIVLAFLISLKTAAQEPPGDNVDNILTPEELNVLVGEWIGTLTYMDYSSNQPYTMPANVKVEKGKDEKQLTLFYIYPNEPKANSKGKIKVSTDGSQVNGRAVKSKLVLPDGQLEVITEYDGKDNSEKAQIRNIYILGEKVFVIRKEVRFEESDEWLQRSEFRFER